MSAPTAAQRTARSSAIEDDQDDARDPRDQQ